MENGEDGGKVRLRCSHVRNPPPFDGVPLCTHDQSPAELHVCTHVPAKRDLGRTEIEHHDRKPRTRRYA